MIVDDQSLLTLKRHEAAMTAESDPKVVGRSRRLKWATTVPHGVPGPQQQHHHDKPNEEQEGGRKDGEERSRDKLQSGQEDSPLHRPARATYRQPSPSVDPQFPVVS